MGRAITLWRAHRMVRNVWTSTSISIRRQGSWRYLMLLQLAGTLDELETRGLTLLQRRQPENARDRLHPKTAIVLGLLNLLAGDKIFSLCPNSPCIT